MRHAGHFLRDGLRAQIETLIFWKRPTQKFVLLDYPFVITVAFILSFSRRERGAREDRFLLIKKHFFPKESK